MLSPPLPREDSKNIELIKGPNIASLPTLSPLPDRIELPVLLKVGDDISTDEILPAGARILPYRSNIPKISEYTFEMVDETYVNRARQEVNLSGHAILGGRNYGQGSSREHAALAPRYLGLRVVLAKSFARIHQQNLVNFGVLPVTFVDPQDYDRLEQGDKLLLLDIEDQIKQAYENGGVTLEVSGGRDAEIEVSHSLSKREIEVLLAGGLTNWIREKWD
jgi:aconitate hydratase